MMLGSSERANSLRSAQFCSEGEAYQGRFTIKAELNINVDELRWDHLGYRKQQVASFGQLRLAATTIKQGDIQLFQVRIGSSPQAGDIQTVSGFLNAALARDRPQDAKLIKSARKVG